MNPTSYVMWDEIEVVYEGLMRTLQVPTKWNTDLEGTRRICISIDDSKIDLESGVNNEKIEVDGILSVCNSCYNNSHIFIFDTAMFSSSPLWPQVSSLFPGTTPPPNQLV